MNGANNPKYDEALQLYLDNSDSIDIPKLLGSMALSNPNQFAQIIREITGKELYEVAAQIIRSYPNFFIEKTEQHLRILKAARELRKEIFKLKPTNDLLLPIRYLTITTNLDYKKANLVCAHVRNELSRRGIIEPIGNQWSTHINLSSFTDEMKLPQAAGARSTKH